MLEALIFVVFPFCMAFAIVSDMVSMTIANRVSIILVVTFAFVAPLTGMGWTDYGWHLAAGAIVFCVTFGLFAFGAMGGGDAKLLAATALWMGLSPQLASYLLVASIYGGALTLAILIYRKSPLSILTGGNILLRNFADEKVGVPYGVALGLAGLTTYPSTAMMQWALANLAAG